METPEEIEKAQREAMTERALKAEEDIKSGRVYTFEEAKKKLRRKSQTAYMGCPPARSNDCKCIKS